MFSAHKLTKWTAKATNKMSWVTQTEMTSLQSRRLFLPVISTCVTVILLIGWWGPPAFHQSKSNTNLVLTTRRGQHSVCQDRETILVPVNPKQKMQRLYVIYLFFYSKIGPFTCKSNAFAEEYEKRDTTMALKEIHFTKRHRKTLKYLWESEFFSTFSFICHNLHN